MRKTHKWTRNLLLHSDRTFFPDRCTLKAHQRRSCLKIDEMYGMALRTCEMRIYLNLRQLRYSVGNHSDRTVQKPQRHDCRVVSLYMFPGPLLGHPGIYSSTLKWKRSHDTENTGPGRAMRVTVTVTLRIYTELLTVQTCITLNPDQC